MSGARQADRSGRRSSSFPPMQGGVGHSRSRTLDRTTYHTYTATTNAREPSSGQQMHGDRMERSASSSTVELSGVAGWTARSVHGSLVLSDGDAVPRRVDELVALAEVVVHR